MPSRSSILFVNQNYYPEVVSAGQRLTSLAEFLASEGFDVHVVCGRGGYGGESSEAPLRETHNGVHIRRFRTPSFGRAKTIGRLADYLAFFLQALLHVLTRTKPDMLVTLTTPPLVNLLGTTVRSLRGVPYGIWAMDLHPESEKALGMLEEGSPLTRLLDTANDASFREADFVVALGTYMKKRIVQKGVAPENVAVIPVWAMNEERVDDTENPLLSDLGLDDKFVVLYAGNAGLFHEFDGICESMRLLKDHPDIFFLFVGDGPRREKIESFVHSHDIDNFRYHDYVPHEQLKNVLSLADVHLLSLRPDIAGLAVPSKLYDSMTSAQPVLMYGPQASEPAETIAEGAFGFIVDPEQCTSATDAGQKLASHLLDLYEDSDKASTYGRRALETYRDTFGDHRVFEAWSMLLEKRIAQIQTSDRGSSETTPQDVASEAGFETST